MSVVSTTNAQRYELGYSLNVAANFTQRFVNNTSVVTTAQEAEMAPALQNAADALATAGYSAAGEGSVIVSDGDSIQVRNFTGSPVAGAQFTVTDTEHYATLPEANVLVGAGQFTEIRRYDGSVIAGGLTGAEMRLFRGAVANVRLPSRADAVVNGQSCPVQNSAGAAQHNATATVGSNGVLSSLRLAATAAIVDDAQALTVPVTGTYTTTATLTVANGVVTGIVLS